MATQETRGHVNRIKGKVKEAVGIVTGNKKLERDGAVERGKGAIQETAGKAARKVSEVLDDVSSAIKR